MDVSIYVPTTRFVVLFFYFWDEIRDLSGWRAFDSGLLAEGCNGYLKLTRFTMKKRLKCYTEETCTDKTIYAKRFSKLDVATFSKVETITPVVGEELFFILKIRKPFSNKSNLTRIFNGASARRLCEVHNATILFRYLYPVRACM